MKPSTDITQLSEGRLNVIYLPDNRLDWQLLSPFHRLTDWGYSPQIRYRHGVWHPSGFTMCAAYIPASTQNLNILLSDQFNFKTLFLAILQLVPPRGYFKVPKSSEMVLKERARQPGKSVKGGRPLSSLVSHNACYKIKGSDKSCSPFFSNYKCAYYVRDIVLGTGDKMVKPMTRFLLGPSLHFPLSGSQ